MSLTLSISQATARPEHELLLCTIRPNQYSQISERIHQLAQGSIDWDYVFSFARRHGVLQLLYFHLPDAVREQIPPDQLKRLQNYFQENAARNLLLTAELCRLIEVLASQGIEAIPYKGPMLSVFAYGDVALRRFVDLDVMIRKEDASQAIEVLLRDGYELAKPLTEGQRDVLLRTQHNLQFRRHHGQLIVELHWEVAANLFASSVQASDLWRNLVELDLNQTRLRSPGPDDLLFSLCVHGSRHLWERLLWISDIGWIISRHEVDWHKLVLRAQETNSERMFLLGVHLSAELLGVQLPKLLAQRIEGDPKLDELGATIVQTAFKGTEHVPATGVEIFQYNWKIRRNWSSRVRYLRHAMKPTDSDLDTVVLPRSLVFGYYLMRPFRLFFKTSDGVKR